MSEEIWARLAQSALPWIRRDALRRLGGASAERLEALRQETLADPRVQEQLSLVLKWPWPPMKNHKQAKHPLHRLGLLLDLGLSGEDSAGSLIADRLMQQPSEGGPFRILVNLPRPFGGSGEDEWAWMACDEGPVLAALLRLGRGERPLVRRALAALAERCTEGGWSCAASFSGFRGPGRKTDPCPYANLVALSALSRSPRWRDSPCCGWGAEVLLRHWAERGGRKLRMFGIGTDFRKPRYPAIWYDLLHVLEVLSRVPGIHDDPRLLEMLAALESSAGPDGELKARSVWMAFKGFDFAQKRVPSPTLSWRLAKICDRLRSARP